MTIKLTTANVLHALAIAGQVLNYASNVVPDRYKPIVAGALALGQLIVGKIQHNSPPPVK